MVGASSQDPPPPPAPPLSADAPRAPQVASAAGQAALGVDLAQGFVLGGTSAGANLAAGIAHLAARERLTPPLTGLFLLAGSFCHPDARPQRYRHRLLSVDEIVDAPGLTRQAVDRLAAEYGAPPDDERGSPLLFGSHAGIATRAYFAVCGLDPRRDEAILFRELLEQAGVETRADVYAGLPHAFWALCPGLDESREWLDKLVDGVRWVIA